MKTKIFFLMSMVLFFSCKKEVTPVPDSPKPLPVMLNYDINSQYAALQNNTDPTTVLVGYIDTCTVKFTYQYTEDNITHTAFGIIFPQFDHGNVCLQNKNDTTRTIEDVIKYKTVFNCYEFYFKFGWGDQTFTITPSSIPVGDTTSTVLTVTNKLTNRKARLPLQQIGQQGFCTLYYDY